MAGDRPRRWRRWRRPRSPARAAALGALAVLVVLGVPAALGLAALVAQDEARLGAQTQSRARLVLSVAPTAGAAGGVERLVQDAREPGLVELVVAVDGQEVASTPGLDVLDAPAQVRRALDAGGEALGQTTLGGSRALVAGAADPGAAVLVVASTSRLDARAAEDRAWAGGLVLVVALLVAVAEAVRARDALREERAARERERDLTADLAHELRAPVATLVTAASLVDEEVDDLPVTAREPVALMLAEVSRLERLVDDMLQLSRLEEGDGDLDVEPLDLARLVGSVLSARGWETAVPLAAAGGVLVHGDRRVLARITVNLVENALRHGAGAAVRVAVRQDRGRGVLEVEDDGPGVPPGRRDRVFDRFTSSAGGSSGLGLTLVRAGARAMGGGARLEEGSGGGARVVVDLPLADEQAPAGAPSDGGPAVRHQPDAAVR